MRIAGTGLALALLTLAGCEGFAPATFPVPIAFPAPSEPARQEVPVVAPAPVANTPPPVLEVEAAFETPAAVTVPRGASATDLTPFEGRRVAEAEQGIVALGFEAVRSDAEAVYWLNSGANTCAQIVTSEGVYSSVVMVEPEGC